MNKKIGIFLFAVALILGASVLAFAEIPVNATTQVVATEPVSVVTPATVKEAVNVGNKICPVSGESIDEAKKATYEYEGKIYNFCCPECIDAFKKEPQKYIQKVEDGSKAPAKEEKAQTKSMESMPMSGHESHQH